MRFVEVLDQYEEEGAEEKADTLTGKHWMHLKMRTM